MYRLKQSQTYLHAVLQTLRVVIRGLGRVGRSVDLAALNEIRTQSQAFIQLGQGSKHKEAIINIMQWVEKSRESILQKGG